MSPAGGGGGGESSLRRVRSCGPLGLGHRANGLCLPASLGANEYHQAVIPRGVHRMSGEWECPYCCNPAIVQQELTERRPNLSARSDPTPRNRVTSSRSPWEQSPEASLRQRECPDPHARECTPGGSRLSGWLHGVPRGGLPMTVGRGAANQGTELPASQARLSRGRFGASSDPFRCFGVTVPSQIIGPLGIQAAGCQGHSFLPVLPWQPSLL